jgi:hypothetical protein
MGGTGLGGEMEGAIGNMFGSQIGNSGGFGGLGLKGTGPGGGGMGNTIGVGRLGTRGRGGGAFGYGTGVAQIRRRGEQNVDISVGQPIIMGSLSMEIIRQVIHSHRDQIKYCYSKELTRNPNLAGKVTVKFTISPKGYVSQASVSQTHPEQFGRGKLHRAEDSDLEVPRTQGRRHSHRQLSVHSQVLVR